jgi:hypothetical protein
VSSRICADTAPKFSPANGGLPVADWYSMTPTDQMSERASRSISPCTCSGLMNCGVPSTSPARVSALLPAPRSLAMPKSSSLTRNGSLSSRWRKTLAGLRSRWTIWAWCAAASAGKSWS